MKLSSEVIEVACNKAIGEVAPYTMLTYSSLKSTLLLVIDAIENEIPGDIVECGTWKGGSSFAMLLVQRYIYGKIRRPVWMFDSFQGLPPAGERDGQRAHNYQRETNAPTYFDNCTASLHETQETAKKFALSDHEAIIIPGWFDKTVPNVIDEIKKRGICALRIDCDWYEPVYYVLDKLTQFVEIGAPIIIDDYFSWEGCVCATHDFLSRNNLHWRIRSIEPWHAAWLIKETEYPDKSDITRVFVLENSNIELLSMQEMYKRRSSIARSKIGSFANGVRLRRQRVSGLS